MVHCIYQGVTSYTCIFQTKIVFFSLMIIFVIANSVDWDEMQHYVAYNLGLQFLPKCAVRIQKY